MNDLPSRVTIQEEGPREGFQIEPGPIPTARKIELIDALSGRHLWAERYDREFTEIFALQDDITRNVVTALEVKLTAGEQALAQRKQTKT